ncbi:CPBP family intramembrane glutamic endopeptidase [Clostridium minihomine]|uniref:CPBP family intramembrane glutamic endopeptidase n=1 Tax=Clostridium minihomine TaxID=2045012 RepID=UPI0013E9F555|nr:type II CAAX endopeptidase family protein [Clostridium minihomine]
MVETQNDSLPLPATVNPEEKKKALDDIATVSCRFGLIFLFSFLAGTALERNTPSAFSQWAFAIHNVTYLFLCVLLCIRFLPIRPKNIIQEESRKKDQTITAGVILSLFMLCFMFLFDITLISLLQGIHLVERNQIVFEQMISNPLVRIFTVGIIGPIAEEIIFRGILFSRLQKHGTLFAILATAFTFAIIHDGFNILVAFFFGILGGILRAATGNIFYSSFVHSCNNCAVLLLLGTSPNGLLIFSILLICSVLFCFLYFKYRNIPLKKSVFSNSIHNIKVQIKAEKEKFTSFITIPIILLFVVI